MLDFGVARTDSDATITAEGQLLGTPAYLAPEQLCNERIGPQTDLYALGTMLFEALSGELPFGQLPWMAAVYARVFRQAPSLRLVAPTLPTHVIDAVDAMLLRSARERPRSAAEVLDRLRGRGSLCPSPDLPRVRDDLAIERALKRLRAGRWVDVVGPREADPSRCVRDIGRTLALEGQRVFYTTAARAPFASLIPVIGRHPGRADAPLAEVRREVEASLAERLALGDALMVEDVEALDPCSRDALDAVPRVGAVARGCGASSEPDEAVVAMHPLDDDALRALIAGPDRVLHLQRDGARLLASRTGGWPARVEREARAWVDVGLARWSGDRLVLRRNDLERIETTQRPAPSASTLGVSWRAIPEHLLDLLTWTALAWPYADVALLAKAMGVSRWEIEAGLDELALGGAVRREQSGSFTVETPVVASEVWPDAQRAAAHRALASALPEGAEARLLHLVAASTIERVPLDTIVEVGVSSARHHAAEGRLGRAEAVLRETLHEVRRHGDAAPTADLPALSAWVDIALALNTPEAFDRALYEVSRSQPQTDAHRHLDALLRAAHAARTSASHALAIIDALPVLEDMRLDWWRQSIKVVAARRCSLEDEARVVDDAAAWATRVGTPEARASLAAWRARLSYRQNRFADAASLWLDAARLETVPERRLSAMTGAASALMEAARHEEAEALALEALDEARSVRHVYFEARSEWLIRATRYRLGRTTGVDRELLDTLAEVGVADLEALLCLTEAAVAWRLGETSECASLAARVVTLWTRSGWSWPLVLPRALAATCRGDRDELERLAGEAIECPLAAVGIQALALIALAVPELRAPLRPAVLAQADRIDRATWDARMEVVSVTEALQSVEAPHAPR